MTVPPPSVRIESGGKSGGKSGGESGAESGGGPGIDAWSPRESITHEQDRAQLISLINERAHRLGTGSLNPSCPRLIATGHQAQLWHPGILAKDIAMDMLVQRAGTGTAWQGLHVVVDQDINEAWRLDVPRLEGDALKVRSVLLARQVAGVPTGFQRPADVQDILGQIDALDSSLTDHLREAFKELPKCESLAEQVVVLLARLKKPYVGDVPIMMVSDLVKLPVFISIIDRMLNDAHRCATVYNAAAAQFPGAGMAPMAVGRELVELPLWAVAWGQPRRRVFVDLADSDPMFVFEDGEPVDRTTATLLPRALLLTAMMRGYLCDLFIHGSGGLVYDRITERWWHDWTGDTLAPMAAATADVFLDLGAPVAGADDLARAVWRRHHLPHNLDRVLNLDGEAVRRKHELLDHMDDDRDKARRRDAFRELKQINRELAEQHPAELAGAARALELARAGVGNAKIAGRRDWCFALYPREDLHRLRRLIDAGRAVNGEVQSPL